MYLNICLMESIGIETRDYTCCLLVCLLRRFISPLIRKKEKNIKQTFFLQNKPVGFNRYNTKDQIS